MLHAEGGRQSNGLFRKRRRRLLNVRLLESSRGQSTTLKLNAPFTIHREYHETWSHSSDTTITEYMENPGKGLFLRVRPQSGIFANEDEASNRSQPTSNNAVDSTSPSASATTLNSTVPTADSLDLPRALRHVRHYTIGAKLDAPVQSEQQTRRQSWASRPGSQDSNPTRNNVIITRKASRKREEAPVPDSRLFPGFDYSTQDQNTASESLHGDDGEAWWKQKANPLQGSMQGLAMTSDLSSQPENRHERIAPRRKSGFHDCPPASYRDPFAYGQEEGVLVKTRQRVKPDSPHYVPVRRSSMGIVSPSSRTGVIPSHSDSSASTAQGSTTISATPEPQRVVQDRRHSRSRSLASTIQSTRTNNLPDPEDVYRTETHYFADCPHVSPPAHRPLNVQPQSVFYQPGSLRFPSLKLQAQLHAQPGFAPQVSIIEGACPQCDWQVRRDAETTILTGFGLTKRRIEKQFASVGHDGEVEAALAELSRAEEDEIKRCWRGYTARWGPGAIGINRGRGGSSAGGSASVSRSSSKDRSAASDRLTANVDEVVQEGRMRLDWVRPER